MIIMPQEEVQVSFNDFNNWFESNKDEILLLATQEKEENDKLHKEFLKEWPLEKLSTMTIDEYVIGKGAQNKSLCYELEMGKYANLFMGIKGGSAAKFGIYWSKNNNAYCDNKNVPIPNDQLDSKFSELKANLVEILEKGIALNFTDDVFGPNGKRNAFMNRAAMIIKLLCAYSKDSFFGVNNNKYQKEVWNNLVSLTNQGGVYKQNHEILKRILDKYPELSAPEIGNILWEYSSQIMSSNDNETTLEKDSEQVEETTVVNKYQLKHSQTVINSKNVVFRGAPGTGKTYFANQIAADIVSNGRTLNISELTDEEKHRIGFVQFHPSYDYTDFVEGLRPSTSEDGVVNFVLKPGSFMSFVDKAKSSEIIGGQDNFEDAWQLFFNAVSESAIDSTGYNKLQTLTGKSIKDLQSYERNEIQGVYPAGTTMYWNHDQIYNVYRGLQGVPKGGLDNYRKAIINHLKKEYGLKDYIQATESSTNTNKYVFIIDEINRGEISKIFGELFFSLDPDYRGNKEGVLTQYANLHKNPEEKFYIPENVYIIGTMNDIDRSVDTFDFAMRRRFTFLEITAEDSAENMNLKNDIKKQMARLNSAIVKEGGLTEDYQIGASYFKEMTSPEFDETHAPLWERKLYPLLKDYFRGEHKASDKLESIKKEYFKIEED